MDANLNVNAAINYLRASTLAAGEALERGNRQAYLTHHENAYEALTRLREHLDAIEARAVDNA